MRSEGPRDSVGKTALTNYIQATVAKKLGLCLGFWLVRTFCALLAGPYTKVDKDARISVGLRFGAQSR
jgi:hypothetical protein